MSKYDEVKVWRLLPILPVSWQSDVGTYPKTLLNPGPTDTIPILPVCHASTLHHTDSGILIVYSLQIQFLIISVSMNITICMLGVQPW